ncbi:MAG TPA: LysE family transporter [Terriglobia bacterium]|nr:LysE family transporter [Terriglobia bacterium]
MDLFLIGATMGIAGGLMPSSLHLIALSQVALNRWMRALLILIGLPLVIDGALLLVTFFFYQIIPQNIAHYVAYLGGTVLILFGSYALLEARKKSHEELASSASVTRASVSAALLSEVAAPGTWVFWLTIAGPILEEGRTKGYAHIIPFFGGTVLSYYGAAILSVWLMAWGASLHKKFNQKLFMISNFVLVVFGISYLVRAYFWR